MIRYLHQWARNRIGKPVLPLELILFATGRCTFRCKHCFISKFETDSSTDLSLEVINQLASDLPALMVLMLTGGEPFLRDDLSELVRIFAIRSQPKVVSIATNGFLTEKCVEMVEQILTLPEFHSQLVVTVSFEGIGQDHDNNRGNPHAYEKALATARLLKDVRFRYPNLSVGANMTLIRENETKVISAVRELANLDLFSFLTQNMYREAKPFSAFHQIDLHLYRELSRFVQSYSTTFDMSGNLILGRWHHYKERYQASLIERTCDTNTYQGVPCEAGRGIGMVYSDGRVAPCELYPPDWGNIKEKSFSDIWNAKGNREFSEQVRSKKCFCTHECFLSASLNLQLAPMLTCLRWNLLQGNHQG